MLTEKQKENLINAFIRHVNSLKTVSPIEDEIVIDKGTIIPVNEDEILQMEEQQTILDISPNPEEDELGCFFSMKHKSIEKNDITTIKIYATDTLYLLFNKIKEKIHTA